jgi:RNA polymerase sigma-70 factor, ECF subfamily
MEPRNILGAVPLQRDMFEDVAAAHTSRFGGLEGAALPGFEAAVPAGAGAVASEERALIERARTGDQDAFGVLVRLHQRQVYQLALRMLRDSEDATEAAQEVFLAAWQGLRGFRGDARFATWLYRIAYNYCLKAAEHRRRDATARAELAAESAHTHSPASALAARHAQDAEQAMREAIRGEIANLPAKYRAALVLRHLQDLSYEEMAEVMRVPIGTVKTHLFRARALLRERLEGLGHARDEGISRAGELRANLEAGLRGMLERGREREAPGKEHAR